MHLNILSRIELFKKSTLSFSHDTASRMEVVLKYNKLLYMIHNMYQYILTYYILMLNM